MTPTVAPGESRPEITCRICLLVQQFLSLSLPAPECFVWFAMSPSGFPTLSTAVASHVQTGRFRDSRCLARDAVPCAVRPAKPPPHGSRPDVQSLPQDQVATAGQAIRIPGSRGPLPHNCGGVGHGRLRQPGPCRAAAVPGTLERPRSHPSWQRKRRPVQMARSDVVRAPSDQVIPAAVHDHRSAEDQPGGTCCFSCVAACHEQVSDHDQECVKRVGSLGGKLLWRDDWKARWRS